MSNQEVKLDCAIWAITFVCFLVIIIVFPMFMK